MPRAPFQVTVFPFLRIAAGIRYVLFQRADDGCWQPVAGGGEVGETPIEAAQREAFEEAGIRSDTWIPLDTVSSVAVSHFRDSAMWGEDLYVIPVCAFGVQVEQGNLVLSAEHSRVQWAGFETARAWLTYDGDRTALWELNQRVLGKGPRE